MPFANWKLDFTKIKASAIGVGNSISVFGAGIILSMGYGTMLAQMPGGRAAEPTPSGVSFSAERFPGSDILARAQAAFVACGWTCTVVIPSNAEGLPYAATSTLAIPLRNLSAPTLVMTGACIHYTGAGYAIDTYEVQPNPASVRLRILDGCLTGTEIALGGIRLLPTSDVTISGTRIADFTNGDAVAVRGTEDVNIVGNYSFSNNRYGVRIQGTFCRQGLPLLKGMPYYSCTEKFDMKDCDGNTFLAHDGVCGYAGNMLHVHDGALSNLSWDSYEQGSPGLEHLSNSYQDNELNGGGGGILLEMSRGDRISSNYFEAKRGHYIVLGDAEVNPEFYVATATAIESNYFTTNGEAVLDVENANYTSIGNNSELLGSPSACFVDSKKVGTTLYGNNKVASASALCRRGSPNAGATDAMLAHFHGDPVDGRKLEFVLREDDAGGIFFGGTVHAPNGLCAAAGQWVYSQDGHLSVCLRGIWVQKL
jgi:hypothetical protein